jgi:uncharacterized DUF497 family protein
LTFNQIVHTIYSRKITFDPAKNDRNIQKRGLSFERAADFDFETAVYSIDRRHDYGEDRIVTLGDLDGRLHIMCFVETLTGIRVISFRRANFREVKKYEKQKTFDQ